MNAAMALERCHWPNGGSGDAKSFAALPPAQGCTPLDLLSRELQAYLQAGTQAELFAWGNGANFQLGASAHLI